MDFVVFTGMDADPAFEQAARNAISRGCVDKIRGIIVLESRQQIAIYGDSVMIDNDVAL